MNITKFGHSCFLVEEEGVRILFDPGSFSRGHTDVTNLDAVLITHEHGDHMDMDSMKQIVSKNPGAVIYTNASVQKLLEAQGIASTVVTHGEVVDVNGVSVEGVGKDHAILMTKVPAIENVGFMVAGRLFYPGDALTIPAKKVEILALPAAAPWMKISETIDYAIAIKPRYAFPVHEAIYAMPQMMYGMLKDILAAEDIEFRPMDPDGKTEF